MTDIDNPLDLFEQLDINPKGQIQELWPCQNETLKKYYEDFSILNRVAIELPTGSGKSIIALLILETWRRAEKRVAILVSSKELGKDMARRCSDLGIKYSLIAGKEDKSVSSKERFRSIRNYQRKKTVGILNYWAYLRGTDIPTPDVLVIDDADNFSDLLYDEYSVVISKKENEDIYLQIIRFLKNKPIYQRLEQFEIESHSKYSQLIYFHHSIEVISLLRKIIHSNNYSTVLGDLYWDYRRNGDKIDTYLLLIKSDEIIFTPHVIPGEVPKLSEVHQIIFMSATLGSKELLHRSMGSYNEISILQERDLSSEIGTMGKRIIFPLTGGATTWQTFNEIFPRVIRIIKIFKKVMILCNSFNESYRLKKDLEMEKINAWIYGIELGSESFSKIQEGVLIVAGRLIGIDFPDDACRIEIITRMPFYFDADDIISNDILQDTDYMIEKTSKRLIQAFGRCNRSPQDYAAYFVIDGRLAEDALGDENYIQYFPHRMKAELEYGLENTIEGGLESAIKISKRLLSKELDTFEEDIGELSGLVSEYPVRDTKIRYLNKVKAWNNLSSKKNYLEAAKNFSCCIYSYADSNATPIEKRKRAWYCYLTGMSYYLAWMYFNNEEYKEKSIELLEDAIKHGNTSWFSGLQLVVNELNNQEVENEALILDINIQSSKEKILRNCEQYIRDNSSKKRTPRESWERMRKIIMVGKHNQILVEIEKTFIILGFEARTLRKKEGEPDLLLFSNIGDEKFVCIIEIKSKDKDDGTITAADINQISGSIQKYKDEYSDYKIYPIIFTNKTDIHELAITKAKNSVRIIKAAEFTSYLINFYEFIEKSSQISSQVQKFALLQKIPDLTKYIKIFKPQEDVVVSLEDFHIF